MSCKPYRETYNEYVLSDATYTAMRPNIYIYIYIHEYTSKRDETVYP